MFAQPVSLNYDGGKTKYTTISGLLLSLVLVLTTLSYAIRQQMVMINRQDIVVNSYLEIGGALPISMDGYGKDQGLAFAFGIGRFMHTEESIDH